MAKLRDTHVNNNLMVASGLSVDGKIGNDNILRPIITVSGTAASRVIQVDMSKFVSNADTNNGRPKLHWWTSTSRWLYPVIWGGGYSPTLNNGVNLDPTTIGNTAVLRTSLTDSNHIWKMTITAGSSSPTTYYFMCSVQGIVYSESFTINITEG
jgi:hypothetical protein